MIILRGVIYLNALKKEVLATEHLRFTSLNLIINGETRHTKQFIHYLTMYVLLDGL